MTNNQQRIFFILVLLLFFIFQGGTVFAFNLEIKYPTIPGFTPPTNASLPEYINYILNLLIFAAGVIAALLLVVGGVQYVIAAKPETKIAAKEQISSAAFGLLLLFSIYIILNTLNPQFTKLTTPEFPQITPLVIPTENPPPPGFLGTLINAQIPFGSIIDKQKEANPAPQGSTPLAESLFDGWKDKEGGRMNRIWEIAYNTEQIAKDIKTHSEDLVREKAKCTCLNWPNEPKGVCAPPQPASYPVPPGDLSTEIHPVLVPCWPAGQRTNPVDIINSLGLGGANALITQDLSGIVGANNLNPALQIGGNIAAQSGSLDNFTSVLGSFQNVAGLNPTNLSNVWGTAANLANISNLSFTNLPSMFGALNNLTGIPGVTNVINTLNNTSVILQPIQSIIQDPTNINTMFGQVGMMLNQAGAGQGILDQFNNVSRIAAPVGIIINDPTNLGTLTSSLDMILSNAGVSQSIIGNLDLAGLGTNLQNTILQNPTNISGIFGSVTGILSNPSISPYLGSGVLDQFNYVGGNIIPSVQNITHNPTVNSVSQCLGNAGIAQQVINSVIRNFSNYRGLLNIVSANPANISGILGSLNGILTSPLVGGPNLNNLNGVHVLDIVSPVQYIINNPTDIGGITTEIGSMARFAGASPTTPDFQLISLILSPTQQIITALDSNNFSNPNGLEGEIGRGVGEILSNAGLNQDQIQGRFQNYSGAITILEQTIIRDRTNIGAITGSVGNLLSQAGVSSDVVHQVNQVASLSAPIQNIIQNPTNISGTFQAVSSVLSPLLDSGHQGVLSQLDWASQIVSPLQGLINDPTNMQTIMGSASQLFSQVGLQNISQTFDALAPMGNLFGNTSYFNLFTGYLQGFTSAFPNIQNLQSVFQNFQSVAGIIPTASFSDLMTQSLQPLTAMTQTIGGFNQTLGDFGQLGGTFFSGPPGISPDLLLGGITASAICASATGDACTRARGNIQTIEAQNLTDIYGSSNPNDYQPGRGISIPPPNNNPRQINLQRTTSNLVREQQEAADEVKKLKETIDKLEQAEQFMAQCPATDVFSLAEFLTQSEYYRAQKDQGAQTWFFKETKYWNDVPVDQGGATTYCSVSGTQWPGGAVIKQPFSKSHPDELIGCSVKIPAGELIDRAKRIGNKLVERLETLINLDQKLIAAVNDLHMLISQCTSQSPQCCTVCISIPVGWPPTGFICVPGSIPGFETLLDGPQPCHNQAIADKLTEIQKLYERANQNDPEGIKNVAEEDKTTTGGETATTNLQTNKTTPPIEDTGIITIIDNIVPYLIRDLDSLVRSPMRSCATQTESESTRSTKPQKEQFTSCEGALKTVGPNGDLIKDCCYDNSNYKDSYSPPYKECLGICYLETEYAKSGSGSSVSLERNYTKCLHTCLEQQAQKTNTPSLVNCIHKLDYFCCGTNQ